MTALQGHGLLACLSDLKACTVQKSASSLLTIGLGCRRGCSSEALRALLTTALAGVGKTLDDVAALATIEPKALEPGLLELAAQIGKPLYAFTAAELAGQEAYLTHRSAKAFAATGCHGVAESAARLLAERLQGAPITWVVTRQHSATATLAIAQGMARSG